VHARRFSGLTTYLFLKFGGYTVWSYVGLRWFDIRHSSLSAAVGRGMARIVIGWFTGVLVAPVTLVPVGTNHISAFCFTALPESAGSSGALFNVQFRPHIPLPALF
jgi:hypothetical protein